MVDTNNRLEPAPATSKVAIGPCGASKARDQPPGSAGPTAHDNLAGGLPDTTRVFCPQARASRRAAGGCARGPGGGAIRALVDAAGAQAASRTRARSLGRAHVDLQSPL